MFIDLPANFRYNKNNSDYAEVKNGILYMHRSVPFRKVMYNITLCLKNKETCCYCKKPIKKKQLTLDHLYSQDMGGPTIPNNLVPCCEKCNSKKSNLSFQQYKYLLLMHKRDVELYRELIAEQQELIKKSGKFDLPKGWVSFRSPKNFIVRVDMDKKYKGAKYSKIVAYYEKYGTVQKPIIVDANGFVLDGYTTLMFAKEYGVKKLPVIILENVIVKL